MAGDQEGNVTIIIRKKKGGGGGHHGGAWKVAYADFVTAMMAFFLLLWLLNATTTEQKLGISNYFDPSGAVKNQGGGDGVLGGQSPAPSALATRCTVAASSGRAASQAGSHSPRPSSSSARASRRRRPCHRASKLSFATIIGDSSEDIWGIRRP